MRERCRTFSPDSANVADGFRRIDQCRCGTRLLGGGSLRFAGDTLRCPLPAPFDSPTQDASGAERMIWGNQMTIQIPDDLARGLEGLAAAQRKSVEQLALERLRSLLDAASSPEAVLRAVRELPHPSSSAVDDLDAAIAAARLPVRDQGAFDRWPRG